MFALAMNTRIGSDRPPVVSAAIIGAMLEANNIGLMNVRKRLFLSWSRGRYRPPGVAERRFMLAKRFAVTALTMIKILF
jgi:hypothetical protein